MTSQYARKVLQGTVALAGLATVTACSIPMYRLGVDACPTATVASTDKVVVQYLGVGGVLISHGSDVVLTAPLYSNPNLLEFLLDHEVRTDTALVDTLLPPGAAKAKAIVVGHSHYDHLMDVPYVALHGAKGAKIYGSETTRHLLAKILPDLQKLGSDVVALDGQAHDPHGHQGDWVDVSPTLRLMAVLSEHSDQVVAKVPFGPTLPLHFGRGKVEKDRTELPRTTSEWAEGTVFSYVIDFRESSGQKTVFRVYYQDSGTNSGVGYLPKHVKDDGKAVDLAILCVGGAFDRLTRHPEGILVDTKPRFALLAHWEDFFLTQTGYCVNGDGVPGIPSPNSRILGGWRRSDTERFTDRVRATAHELGTEAWWLPCPTRSRFELPLAGDSSKIKESKAALCPLP